MRWVGSRRAVVACLLGLSVVAGGSAWGDAPSCNGVLSAVPAAAEALSLDQREIDAVKGFYVTRNDRCAWPEANIKALTDALSAAGDQALDSARYRPDAIRGATPATTRDLYATAMALRFAHDLVFGRGRSRHGGKRHRRAASGRRPAAQLDCALGQPNFAEWLAGLASSDPAYRRLVEAYRRLRDRPFDRGPEPIGPGPVVKLGDPTGG